MLPSPLPGVPTISLSGVQFVTSDDVRYAATSATIDTAIDTAIRGAAPSVSASASERAPAWDRLRDAFRVYGTTPSPPSLSGTLSVRFERDTRSPGLVCTLVDTYVYAPLRMAFELTEQPRDVVVDDDGTTTPTSRQAVTHGRITGCRVQGKDVATRQFKALLIYVCDQLPAEEAGRDLVLATGGELRVLTVPRHTNGFVFYPRMGVSIQGVEASKCLHAVRLLCHHKRWSLHVRVRLRDVHTAS